MPGTVLSAYKMLITVAGAGNCPVTTVISVISFSLHHNILSPILQMSQPGLREVK